MTEYADEFDDDGIFDDFGAGEVSPELVQAVAAQIAQQQPQGVDPIQQAHADAIAERVPDIGDPNSYASQAAISLVHERAQQLGVPELASDMRFARKVIEDAPASAFVTPQEARADAIFNGAAGKKVLPFG